MRVSFLLPTVGMSGGIRVVAIYAKWLADKGHIVTLISPPTRPPSLRKKMASLLKGKGWPIPFQLVQSHLDGLGLNHRVLESWRRPRDRDVPDGDAVIATWWETAEWVNALSPSKGAKVYFVQHHEVFDYLPVARCKATYRMPLHKIVIARWLVEVMRDEYGDDTVDLVPNAIDHQQFYARVRCKQSVPTVGFLYHEVHFKGVDVVLAALSKLRKQIPNLRAICFGSNSPSGRLQLGDFVEFHLEPPQDSLRNLYGRCDVWLAASRSEGFNLTAMEAMACRTPVVSTRAGWPEEAISNGYNGKLVDIDDVEGLARGALEILCLSDEDWLLCSNNAWATVADSSWKKSSQLFEEALIHACRRSKLGEIAGRCGLSNLQGCP